MPSWGTGAHTGDDGWWEGPLQWGGPGVGAWLIPEPAAVGGTGTGEGLGGSPS
jgi:hypothetical protein